MIASSNAALQDQLLTIERRLWTNDADSYQAHLTGDAVLIFPETGAMTRDTAVAEIRKENAEGRRWERVEFTHIRCARLADDVALLTYQVVARWAHETSSSSAFASSVYVRRAGEWRLAFHQQTPVIPETRSSD
jgi:hypothetical protein